jgi:hypothetical protein
MTADIEAPKDLPYGQPERKEVSQKLGFPVLLGFIVNLNQNSTYGATACKSD